MVGTHPDDEVNKSTRRSVDLYGTFHPVQPRVAWVNVRRIFMFRRPLVLPPSHLSSSASLGSTSSTVSPPPISLELVLMAKSISMPRFNPTLPWTVAWTQELEPIPTLVVRATLQFQDIFLTLSFPLASGSLCPFLNDV